jgi:hypothetical protein
MTTKSKLISSRYPSCGRAPSRRLHPELFLPSEEVMTASTIATSSDISSTPPTPVNSAASSIQLDDSENDDNNSTSYNSAEDSDSNSSVGTVQHVLQPPIVVQTMAVSVQKFIAPPIFAGDVLVMFWTGWNHTKWQQFIIAGQTKIGLTIFLCTWMGPHGNGF